MLINKKKKKEREIYGQIYENSSQVFPASLTRSYHGTRRKKSKNTFKAVKSFQSLNRGPNRFAGIDKSSRAIGMRQLYRSQMFAGGETRAWI